MTEQSHDSQSRPQRARPTVTAVELADIAGVEANTVRKIANELLDMLKRDLETE